MVRARELSSFRQVFPQITAATQGNDASLAELVRAGQEAPPDVLSVATPAGFGHDPQWVRSYLRSIRNPVVLFYEGDAWGRWSKPINRSMSGWLATSDIVFTVAREPQLSLFRKHGARDVRFVPSTYCHAAFREAEWRPPERWRRVQYDVVVVGNRLARWGRVSRMLGAVQRAKLVRKLQRDPRLRVSSAVGTL